MSYDFDDDGCLFHYEMVFFSVYITSVTLYYHQLQATTYSHSFISTVSLPISFSFSSLIYLTHESEALYMNVWMKEEEEDDDDDDDDDNDSSEDSLLPLPWLERRFLVDSEFDFILSSAASSTAFVKRLIILFVTKPSTPLAPSIVSSLHVGHEMVRLFAILFKQAAQKVCRQFKAFGNLFRFSMNFSKQISQETISAMISFCVRA